MLHGYFMESGQIYCHSGIEATLRNMDRNSMENYQELLKYP